MAGSKLTEYTFHVPGDTFTDGYGKAPSVGSWVPCEECHYVVVNVREDGSYDCVKHPKEDAIAAAALDMSVTHAEAMRRAHAIATEPSVIAEVLAKAKGE